MKKHITSDELFEASRKAPFIIAGPCVLESLDLALNVATTLARLAEELGLVAVFKSSFDKANRTSLSSFRGPGLKTGLDWLKQIKSETGLPIITDVHAPDQAAEAAAVADVIQVPAFLCRQTDLLLAAGAAGRIVNVKKGQFLAPWDVGPLTEKIISTGNRKIWLTERGASFGYNNLVVDMRSVYEMGKLGYPVVFDATHSVQLPGGQGTASGGRREYVPVLARAAVAAGANGVFLEVHPDPDKALCDGPNSWPLHELKPLLEDLLNIWRLNR